MAILEVGPLGFPWKTKDPFLFCVHHLDFYPEGNEKMEVEREALEGRTIGNDFTIKDGWRMYHGSKVPGFPYHPHRGFETITINKKGVVDHSDSLGAAGRFMGGDVQWMTAGKGVLHSEMFPMLNTDSDNTLEIFQIWLNLPKASKFVEPHFKMLWKENIPKFPEIDQKGKKAEIELIAGAYKSSKAISPTPDSWAANPDNAVRVMTIDVEANGSWMIPSSPPNVNKVLYFFKGDAIQVAGKKIEVGNYMVLTPDLSLLLENLGEEAKFLLLEGKPINEPVVQYGPFVMNTDAEIHQAYEDYRKTQFGGWPWEKEEMVHHRAAGRFALHADGKKEAMD